MTWRAAAYSSAEFMVATSALVHELSPTLKSWPMPLWDITSPLLTAVRTYAANVAANFAGVLTSAGSTRSSRMVASGATAWTSSVSSTSSTPANHGEADEPAKVVITWIRAGGSPNRLSKSARSCRMSVTDCRRSVIGWGRAGPVSASSGSTTVTPWPVIPRSSSGSMP